MCDVLLIHDIDTCLFPAIPHMVYGLLINLRSPVYIAWPDSDQGYYHTDPCLVYSHNINARCPIDTDTLRSLTNANNAHQWSRKALTNSELEFLAPICFVEFHHPTFRQIN